MPITDTVRTILTAAAERADRLVAVPDRLPAAAQRAVVQSMLRAGLLEEIAGNDEQPVWRVTQDDQRLSLKVTSAGLDAVGAASTVLVHAGPTASVRLSLRSAAEAVVAAWTEAGADCPPLHDAILTLQAALNRPSRSPAEPRQPRADCEIALNSDPLRGGFRVQS